VVGRILIDWLLGIKIIGSREVFDLIWLSVGDCCVCDAGQKRRKGWVSARYLYLASIPARRGDDRGNCFLVLVLA
jgi:hypothetical protein